VRWLRRKDAAKWNNADVALPTGTALARDVEDQPVLLLGETWPLKFFGERNPDIELSDLPFGALTLAPAV